MKGGVERVPRHQLRDPSHGVRVLPFLATPLRTTLPLLVGQAAVPSGRLAVDNPLVKTRLKSVSVSVLYVLLLLDVVSVLLVGLSRSFFLPFLLLCIR